MTTTIEHSTLTAGELHEPFHYVAAADPGAIGAGKYWLDSSSTPYVLKRRDATNTSWITIGASSTPTPTYSAYFDIPPTVPNTEDDEFTANTLNAKWTVSHGQGTRTVGTTLPGHLLLQGVASGDIWRIHQAYAPAGAFSVTACFRMFLLATTGDPQVHLYCRDAGDTNEVTMYHTGGNILRFGTLDTGVWTDRTNLNLTSKTISTVYLHLQRDGANNWEGWCSFNGFTWNKLQAAYSKVMTVSHIVISMQHGTVTTEDWIACDWVRRDFITL